MKHTQKLTSKYFESENSQPVFGWKTALNARRKKIKVFKWKASKMAFSKSFNEPLLFKRGNTYSIKCNTGGNKYWISTFQLRLFILNQAIRHKKTDQKFESVAFNLIWKFEKGF